jgi:hypothetical protein
MKIDVNRRPYILNHPIIVDLTMNPLITFTLYNVHLIFFLLFQDYQYGPMKMVTKIWQLARNRPQNIFCLPISYSPQSGTNKQIKWDMCLCILNIILTYFVGICLRRYWKLTLNTHFLLDFIYFHETIDFSLTSVTSSHVQIWKIIIKLVDGVKVFYNQETMKAIRFIYNLPTF